jgi:hypothetical protein
MVLGLSKERAISEAQRLANSVGVPYYIMGIGHEWWIFMDPPAPIAAGVLKTIDPENTPDVIAQRADHDKPGVFTIRPKEDK